MYLEVSPMILSATSCLKDTSISSAKNIYIVRIWGVVGFFSVLRCFSLVDFFESQKWDVFMAKRKGIIIS